MIFSSFEFIFVFLPVVLIVFYMLGQAGKQEAAIAWLVVASLFFYGYWNQKYLLLILISMVINYSLGLKLSEKKQQTSKSTVVLAFGIIFNLSLIGYYKYANFFVDNFNTIFDVDYNLQQILLPLAISFFTFQQIAYLIDSYRGECREYSFMHYALFVTFFPQLIAGPIVHHKEMLPQFSKNSIYRFNYKNFSIGISIFIIGLTKKVVIADALSQYADPFFISAGKGVDINFYEAWAGSLAYTFQLYFDFSGYSDMAVGLARMFGIRLPANFFSPYKSLNITDFWRRWHMTLSRFLRDYLYIPLGGNRKGKSRQKINLMVTMILGGLWHGAGWTFIVWGALHGLYLVVNHSWNALVKRLNLGCLFDLLLYKVFAWLLTFMAIHIAWVFFRADDYSTAMTIVSYMFSMDFLNLPDELFGRIGMLESKALQYGFTFNTQLIIPLLNWLSGAGIIVLAMVIAFFFPNATELFDDKREVSLMWSPSIAWSVFMFILFSLSLTQLFQVSPFLYFNF
ncbi:MAG: MBOAT family O-acyltransferase [Pseudomonadota bacterium]